jgi:hypothetical protein
VAGTKTRGNPGKIYVWHYPEGPRSYSGWHLTADAFGAGRLTGAIEGVLAGSGRETQLFALDPVTPAVLAVPNNRRAKALSAKNLRVRIAGEPRHLSMHEEAGLLTVEAGRARLEELRNSIARVGESDGDFVMVSDQKRRDADQTLFFWWLLP